MPEAARGEGAAPAGLGGGAGAVTEPVEAEAAPPQLNDRAAVRCSAWLGHGFVTDWDTEFDARGGNRLVGGALAASAGENVGNRDTDLAACFGLVRGGYGKVELGEIYGPSSLTGHHHVSRQCGLGIQHEMRADSLVPLSGCVDAFDDLAKRLSNKLLNLHI